MKKERSHNHRALPETVPMNIGYILADDICNMNGVTLVRRNSELSDVVLERLQNLGSKGRPSEPVKVIELVS